jgi:predicted PurR-regulated permease PerM
MNAFALAVSSRSRKLFCLVACGVLIVLVVLILALMPSLVDVLRRLPDWFRGSLPHPIRFWKESPWLY